MLTLAEAPSPIDGLASAAGTLLTIELFFIIVLLAALMVLLALGFKWLHDHVIPLLQQYLPYAKDALGTTDRLSGQFVDMLAAIYGRRKGVEEAVRSFVDALGPLASGIFTTTPPPHEPTPDAPTADDAAPTNAPA
ncbi:MAG: hypothetical protein H0X24_04920 [Ktedonobacterales bacterium]|nr:hypothetical protein [Ktedonobacterales bacterium]